MRQEEIIALCNKAHDVGTVRHADYADYVVAIESRRRSGDAWQVVEQVYMAVDGRLAMANQDHRAQGKRLEFREPQVLQDTAEQLTLLVVVTSELYGTRHGIATSRKRQGTRAEREFPWEVAETSAIGRALAAMGYGLLPGPGLSSVDAEHMLRVRDTQANDSRRGNGKGGHRCALHDVLLEPRGTRWVHRIKGGWCYGKQNGVNQPVAA